MASQYEIEEWLAARLADSPDIAALAGTRVHPVWLPDADLLPAITYHRTGTPRAGSLSGAVGNANPKFRVCCIGKANRQGYKQSLQLGRAARLAIDGFRGEWQGHWIEEATVDDEFDEPVPAEFGDGALGVLLQRVLIVSIDHEEITKNNLQPPGGGA